MMIVMFRIDATADDCDCGSEVKEVLRCADTSVCIVTTGFEETISDGDFLSKRSKRNLM